MSAGHADDGRAPSLPPLLKAIPTWHPGGWAPPAVTLSIGSFFLGIATLVYLLVDPVNRAMFRLPGTSPPLAALPIAGLAWLIGVRCRSRPGGMMPRVWAAALVFAASA